MYLYVTTGLKEGIFYVRVVLGNVDTQKKYFTMNHDWCYYVEAFQRLLTFLSKS